VGPFRAPRAYTPQQSVLKYAPTDITRKHPHIARGTYGVVFKGSVKGIAQEVVIKDMEILDQISVDEWQREIQIMAYGSRFRFLFAFLSCSYRFLSLLLFLFSSSLLSFLS
jgi:hypothetical protein